MKNTLSRPSGTLFSARLLRSTAVLIIGLALAFAFWSATAPMSVAQGMTPTRMIEANLPQGETLENATKPQLLAAVCAAIRKNRGSAPQIVRAAVAARREWTSDIVRTAFNCAGTDDCNLLGRIYRAAIAANPDDASALTDLATSLAPACAGSFQRDGKDTFHDGKDTFQEGARDEGNFGNPPGNLIPPPGSIGGGGGQGNVIAICHNGHTIFVSPQGAENLLRTHPGDYLGPCNVTPTCNP